MQYYKMSQCVDTANIVFIPDISKKELDGSPGLVKQIKKTEYRSFLNFYEKPLPIVSDTFKQTIKTLYPEAIGQPLALADMNTAFSILYWILNLEYTGCKNDGSQLWINGQSIWGRKIFKIKTGIMDHVIVDHDIAEAALRDTSIDLMFKEVYVYGLNL